MKKAEMKEFVYSAIKTKGLCRMLFKYASCAFQYFPLQMSDKLFLAAKLDDFIIDGFSIRRFCDLTVVQLYEDKRNEIIKAEGILDDVAAPEMDITDWYSALLSLQKAEKNIIIEHESLIDDEEEFAIGRVEKVLKNKVLFKHFDADGVWQEELLEIPFSQITSITLGSRYVEIFSKYV